MAWSLFSQSGVSPKSWAESVLHALGAPTTPANTQSMIAWALLEGGGGTYNPLNTTYGMPGASNFNSVGVKNYTSWGEGVTATVDTLRGGYYTSIVSALRSGRGLGSGSYPGLSTWSGGGYSSVAGTWGEAARYMGGQASIIPGSGGQGAQTTGGGILGLIENTYTVFGIPVRWFVSGGSAITDVVGATEDVAKGIAGISNRLSELLAWIGWLFVPSHWVRILAGIFGTGALITGLVLIARTGQSYSANVPGVGQVAAPGGQIAPALGIVFITGGGVLLFIAFHNLPPEVDNFPALLGYVQGKVQPIQAPAPRPVAA